MTAVLYLPVACVGVVVTVGNDVVPVVLAVDVGVVPVVVPRKPNIH